MEGWRLHGGVGGWVCGHRNGWCLIDAGTDANEMNSRLCKHQHDCTVVKWTAALTQDMTDAAQDTDVMIHAAQQPCQCTA